MSPLATQFSTSNHTITLKHALGIPGISQGHKEWHKLSYSRTSFSHVTGFCKHCSQTSGKDSMGKYIHFAELLAVDFQARYSLTDTQSTIDVTFMNIQLAYMPNEGDTLLTAYIHKALGLGIVQGHLPSLLTPMLPYPYWLTTSISLVDCTEKTCNQQC